MLGAPDRAIHGYPQTKRKLYCEKGNRYRKSVTGQLLSLFIYLFIYLFVYLFIYLFIYLDSRG